MSSRKEELMDLIARARVVVEKDNVDGTLDGMVSLLDVFKESILEMDISDVKGIDEKIEMLGILTKDLEDASAEMNAEENPEEDAKDIDLADDISGMIEGLCEDYEYFGEAMDIVRGIAIEGLSEDSTDEIQEIYTAVKARRDLPGSKLVKRTSGDEVSYVFSVTIANNTLVEIEKDNLKDAQVLFIAENYLASKDGATAIKETISVLKKGVVKEEEV